MKIYEMVVMIDPRQKNKATQMIHEYTEIINRSSGKVHRIENWGCLRLSYSVLGLDKMTYVFFNFQTDQETVALLKKKNEFDECVGRSMIVCTKKPIERSSWMAQNSSD